MLVPLFDGQDTAYKIAWYSDQSDIKKLVDLFWDAYISLHCVKVELLSKTNLSVTNGLIGRTLL